ncbi:MAG: alanine racemase [Bauldia sp.]
MSPPESGAAATSAAGGRLTIDLQALTDNWRTVGRQVAPATLGAVVKADAYGIGIEPAVRALSAAGCKTFFVALADEGLRARRVAPDAAIYVLNGLIGGTAPLLIAADLRPVLNSLLEVRDWLTARRPHASGAALHIDTGMNRLGISLEEAKALAARRDLVANLGLTLLMSHLACADTPSHPRNAVQLARFREAVAAFPGIPTSFANSAGAFLSAEYHGDLVRPGVALFGGRWSNGSSPLRPVVTAEARLLAVREVPAGEPLGYGAAETAKRRSRVGILAAGYADGFHRLAGGTDDRPGARLFLHGSFANLIGRVSMDLMAVDVTDLPQAKPGDLVELFGPNIPVDEMAAAAGTIGYEILTGFGRRFDRLYAGTE